MEEMQRLFDKTLHTLNTESKKKDEYYKRLESELEELKQVVDNITSEKTSWNNFLYIFVLAIILLFCFVSFCRRTVISPHQSNAIDIQRRNSVDVVFHNKPPKKQRRPSEEALKIKGSYTELMVDETDGHVFKSGKKRKKRKESPRASSFAALVEENENMKGMSSTNVSIEEQQSASPAVTNVDWVESNEIKDVPIVLEESEHTTLEFTPSINGDAKGLQSFMKTATETRLNRSSSHTPPTDTNGNNLAKHKKSASVDVTTQMESLNGNILITEDTPKKEKKGLFKIFKRK